MKIYDKYRPTEMLRRMLLAENRSIDTCERCNKTNVTIHIHHIDKNPRNNTVHNLKVVCVPCHKREDGYGGLTDYAKANGISVSRAYQIHNPEIHRETSKKQNKKYYDAHKEEIKAKSKARYYKNRERILARLKENYMKKKIKNNLGLK